MSPLSEPLSEPSSDTVITAAHNRSAERIFRMEGALTELVTVGLFGEGLRMRNTFEGAIVGGEPAGGLVRGVDEFVVRPDGVGIVDAREVVTAPGGVLTATVLGYGLPPAGLQMPPLDVLLDPSFEWPDLRFSIECGAVYRTTSPAFEELGRTAVVHLGWVNMGTRELVIEGYRAAGLTSPRAADRLVPA